MPRSLYLSPVGVTGWTLMAMGAGQIWYVCCGVAGWLQVTGRTVEPQRQGSQQRSQQGS